MISPGAFVEIQGAPKALSRGCVVEISDWTATCEVDLLLPNGASVRLTVATTRLRTVQPTISELVGALACSGHDQEEKS